MSIRTAVPILIASIALAGFAPAASAQLPLSSPDPTVAAVPDAASQQLIPTMPVAIAPTTGSTSADPFTTGTTTFGVPPLASTTTETTTVPGPQFPPTTSTESTTAAPMTTVSAAAAPASTVPTTSMPTAAPLEATTTPETTTPQPVSPITTTQATPTTTPRPAGDISLVTSPLTTSTAELGARTLTLTFSVTVTDSRTNSAGWTASAWVSNLVTDDGNVVVPASFSYSSSETACSTASARVLSNSPAVVQSASSACSTSWTVTVVVTLADSATIADVYNATIEHSVTGLTTAPLATPTAA